MSISVWAQQEKDDRNGTNLHVDGGKCCNEYKNRRKKLGEVEKKRREKETGAISMFN